MKLKKSISNFIHTLPDSLHTHRSRTMTEATIEKLMRRRPQIRRSSSIEFKSSSTSNTSDEHQPEPETTTEREPETEELESLQSHDSKSRLNLIHHHHHHLSSIKSSISSIKPLSIQTQTPTSTPPPPPHSTTSDLITLNQTSNPINHPLSSPSHHLLHSTYTNLIKPSSISESILILLGLLLAWYRLNQIIIPFSSSSDPIHLLSFFIIIFISIVSLRHRAQPGDQAGFNTYFRVPFTDARGYRDPAQADDGLAIGLGLPLIVSSAVLYSIIKQISIHNLSSFSSSSQPPTHPLLHQTHLLQLWSNSHSNHFNASIPSHHHQHHSKLHQLILNRLLQARLDLFSFTIINLFSLLLDLALASLAHRLAYLPINNSTRFFGSTLKSSLIASLFGLALSLGWLGQLDISPLECSFSVFTFQSSFYLISRLARRGFSLGEASIFSSTAVALLLEIIRLTASRLDYRRFLDQSYPSNTLPPIKLLPSLFRFPTPLIAIQHVLVSGIFLIGFLLSPLLIWSRRLGQQPTKRSRPSGSRTHHSPARQIISSPRSVITGSPLASTSVPALQSMSNQRLTESYYQQFSNPSGHYHHHHQLHHHTRDQENESKHRMRKILALSIYLGIFCIGLFVLSAWMGWLLDLGQATSHPRSFTSRLLGPGWIWFLSYCFLSSADDDASGKLNYKRIGIIAYWIVCLLIGIGGWSTYLINKRRSRMAHQASWTLKKNISAHSSSSSVTGIFQSNHSTLSSRLTRTEEERGRRPKSKSSNRISFRVSRSLTWLDCLSTRFDLIPRFSKPKFETSLKKSISDEVEVPYPITPISVLHPHDSHYKKSGQGLNFRRKFFHGLACGMFIPAIIIDVS